MIFLSINIQRLARMIYFLTYDIIRDQTSIGKFPLRSGQPFFIALTKANPSEKLQGIMASRMRPLGV
jgi:hypothetical protein